MNNSKSNKRTSALAVLLLCIIILGYKVIFPPDESVAEINVATINRIESILGEVRSINFDMSIQEDLKFQSLKSIETPLISLPIGRKNPFAPI